MRPLPLHVALGLLLPLLSADGAGGVVLCQRGNKFALRAEECAKREIQVPLDADTLNGKPAEDVLAPLEERLRALEEIVASSTPTTTTSTSTTLPGPGLVSCLCADLTTPSACAPQIDCTLIYQPSDFCRVVLCADRGGPGGDSEAAFQLSCDKEAPALSVNGPAESLRGVLGDHHARDHVVRAVTVPAPVDTVVARRGPWDPPGLGETSDLFVHERLSLLRRQPDHVTRSSSSRCIGATELA